MKIRLIYPPFADPALPHPALPALAASAVQAGFTDIRVRDLNLEAFQYFYSTDYLESRAAQAIQFLGSETVDFAIRNIEWALSVVRDRVRFYDPDSLTLAKSVFHAADRMVSAGNAHIRMGRFSYSNLPFDSHGEVLRALDEAGPILPFVQNVAQGIAAESPDVLGMSLAYSAQVIPAMLLAREVKLLNPAIHVTLGGPVATWGRRVVLRDSGFGEWVDSVFAGEAEVSFVRFLEDFRNLSKKSSSIPGLILIGGPPQIGVGGSDRVDLNRIPQPNYSFLPLHQYFVPEPLLGLTFTRGCYYNRCSFCDYSFIKLAPYRVRDPELLGQDIELITKRHDARAFCLESDVIHPLHLSQLANTIVRRGLDIRWHGVAKVERSMDQALFHNLRRAGCVRLFIGLESGSDRILHAMEKGSNSADAERVLKFCADAGIGVEAGFIIGYPGETAADLAETVRFVERNRARLTRADLNRFRLLRGAPLGSAAPAAARDGAWHELRVMVDNAGEAAIEQTMREIAQLFVPDVLHVSEDILYHVAGRATVFQATPQPLAAA
jgi:radical SAM superfamily enzyme YgiQ (UPF0313 family)